MQGTAGGTVSPTDPFTVPWNSEYSESYTEEGIHSISFTKDSTTVDKTITATPDFSNGYHFKEWIIKPTESISSAGDVSGKITANTTFTAVFEKDNIAYYNPNGGTLSGVPDKWEYDEQTACYKKSFPESTKLFEIEAEWNEVNVEKVDYIFDGWTCNAEEGRIILSKDTTWTADFHKKATFDITLTAGNGIEKFTNEYDDEIESTAKVKELEDFKFKVVLKEGWVNPVVKDGDTALTADDDVYTIESIVSVHTITASATEIKTAPLIKVSELNDGDKIIIACPGGFYPAGQTSTKAAFGGNPDSGTYINPAKVTLDGSAASWKDENVAEITVSKIKDSANADSYIYKFTNSEGKVLKCSGTEKQLLWQDEAAGYDNDEWLLTESGTTCTISPNNGKTFKIQYNQSDPRFSTYGSSQKANMSFYLVEKAPEPENITISTDVEDGTIEPTEDFVIPYGSTYEDSSDEDGTQIITFKKDGEVVGKQIKANAAEGKEFEEWEITPPPASGNVLNANTEFKAVFAEPSTDHTLKFDVTDCVVYDEGFQRVTEVQVPDGTIWSVEEDSWFGTAFVLTYPDESIHVYVATNGIEKEGTPCYDWIVDSSNVEHVIVENVDVTPKFSEFVTVQIKWDSNKGSVTDFDGTEPEDLEVLTNYAYWDTAETTDLGQILYLFDKWNYIEYGYFAEANKGYYFAGWKVEPKGDAYGYIQKETTITAVFEEGPAPETHTVHFNPPENCHAEDRFGYAVETAQVPDGASWYTYIDPIYIDYGEELVFEKGIKGEPGYFYAEFYAFDDTEKDSCTNWTIDPDITTIDQNVTFTPEFGEWPSYTVTLKVEGDGEIYDWYTDQPITETTLDVVKGTPYFSWFDEDLNTDLMGIGYDLYGPTFYALANEGSIFEGWEPERGSVTGPLTLTAKFSEAPEPVPVPEPVSDLVYNGQTQTGVAEGQGYTIEGNTAKDANTLDNPTYTAIVTLQDGYVWEDGTTNPKEIDWFIDPKSAEFAWSYTPAKYDGQEHKPSVEVSNLEKGDTCSVTIEYYKDLDKVEHPINSGEYVAWTTAISNTNYEINSPGFYNFEIEKADSAITGLPESVRVNVGYPKDIYNWNYNGDGTIKMHSSDENIATVVWDQAVMSLMITGKENGDAEITIIATEGENYKAPTPVEIKVKVTYPVYLAGHVYDLYTGNPVSGVDVSFSENTTNVTTDDTGYYKLDGLTEGQAGTLTFSRGDYLIKQDYKDSEYMSENHDDADAILRDFVNVTIDGSEGHDTFNYVVYKDGEVDEEMTMNPYEDIVYVDTVVTLAENGVITAEYTDSSSNSVYKKVITPVAKEDYSFESLTVNGQVFTPGSTYTIKFNKDIEGTVSYTHNVQPVPPEPSPTPSDVSGSAQTGDSTEYAVIGLAMITIVSLAVCVCRRRRFNS